MPAKKMRIELFDSDGNRYTIAFEGQITRDKAVRLLDLVELLGGMPADGGNPRPIMNVEANRVSKYDKIRQIVQRTFPLVWFSSKEAQTAYEQELKLPISLSTVATYLSRLTNQGVLEKAGASNNLKYRLPQKLPQVQLKQKIP